MRPSDEAAHRAVCASKARHPNAAAAQRVADRISSRRGGLGARIYRCPACGQWHVTNSNDKIQRKSRVVRRAERSAARMMDDAFDLDAHGHCAWGCSA